MTDPILRVQGLQKAYRKNNLAVPVLRGVDFAATTGAITALVGRSGSGKSTLLHLLATLDAPDAGSVCYRGKRIDNAPRRHRDHYRNRDLGMIFQSYHLLPELSALENVMVPGMIGRGVFRYLREGRELKSRAAELLDRVGLSHRMQHRPRELSGGEMQRTAIARALVHEPAILLADEPTGNLDAQTGQEILGLLKTLNQDLQLTVVMVTHDDAIASLADRTVRLQEGKVVPEPTASSPPVAPRRKAG